MTRIDCAPVEELSDKHLLSNYKELPRAFGYIRTRMSKNRPLVDKTTPKNYTMGDGHVKYLYDKFVWLKYRYRDLHREMVAREFKPTYDENYDISDIVAYYSSVRGNWKPTETDVEVSRSRIKERISEKPHEHSWTLRRPPGYARAILATAKLGE